jgi:hypothetical protein
MTSRLNAVIRTLGLSLLLGCGDATTPDEGADAATESSVVDARAGDAAAVRPTVSLAGYPPEGCTILTEARAVEMLGGAATERPGGCSYVSGVGAEQRFVALSYSQIPLDMLDTNREAPEAMAAVIQGLLQLAGTPGHLGPMAGGHAFTMEGNGQSQLFLAGSAQVTAMQSDRVVGDALVSVGLKNGATHEERIEALARLAVDAANTLTAAR